MSNDISNGAGVSSVVGLLKRAVQTIFTGGKTGGSAGCEDKEAVAKAANERAIILQTVNANSQKLEELKNCCSPKPAPATQPICPITGSGDVTPFEIKQGETKEITIITRWHPDTNPKPTNNNITIYAGTKISAEVKEISNEGNIIVIMKAENDAPLGPRDLQINTGSNFSFKIIDGLTVNENKPAAAAAAPQKPGKAPGAKPAAKPGVRPGAKPAAKPGATKPGAKPVPVVKAPEVKPKVESTGRCKPGPMLEALQRAGVCPK